MLILQLPISVTRKKLVLSLVCEETHFMKTRNVFVDLNKAGIGLINNWVCFRRGDK